MFTVTKTYADLPFAHRQHKHDGHCSQIHGHNWTFEFEFGCDIMGREGFVIDLGRLKWLKDWIYQHFDHTLVLNEDDENYHRLNSLALAKIVRVPNCGMEGIALHLYKQVNTMLTSGENERGVRVLRVTVREDSKNSATYVPES